MKPHTDPQADWGLPGWTYDNDRFFREEQERIFRPSWQIVCHLNDIPKAGDFHTLDYIGESVVVVRGKDGGVRAFTQCLPAPGRAPAGRTGRPLRQGRRPDRLPLPRLDL